jgi:hypothetical protein
VGAILGGSNTHHLDAGKDGLMRARATGVSYGPPPGCRCGGSAARGGNPYKQPWNTHIVVVPRLMTGRWRRALFKEADLTFSIPVGTSFGPKEMHKPLTVVVCFPIISHQPWKLRGTPLLEGLARKLRPLWEFGEVQCGSLLRQLLQRTRGLQGMQEGLVREVLYCPVWESFSHPGSQG